MSTKYFLDCEFAESGPDHPIDLISIGIVSSDDREYYAQSIEFDEDGVNIWVRENVFPHLDIGCSCFTIDSRNVVEDMRGNHALMSGIKRHRGLYPACPWRWRGEIAREILAFMDADTYGKPELIGWCAGYDFVILCQLFGTMMDLPAGWPHFIKDLQHVLDDRSWTDDMLPEQEGTTHNALDDAKHIRQLWTFLEEWHERGVKV